jgi:hypothetical protein
LIYFMAILEYFTDIWDILIPLVYIEFIWYIFFRFWYLFTKKNLATLAPTKEEGSFVFVASK